MKIKRIVFMLICLFALLVPNANAFNLTAKLGSDFSHTFYLGQGARHSISSFALYDATNTTVTSTGHGLSNGDRVIIVNSDYYVGTYTVANSTANTFTIAIAFQKTETKAEWMTAYTLTGYTAEAKIYDAPAGTTELEDMDATVSDAAGGEIDLELTDTEVDAMGISTSLWDLIIIDGSGTREVMVSGVFYVKGYGIVATSGTGTVISVNDPTTTVAVVGGRGPAGAGVTISDTAYGVSWNGDTTTGASKNALYDVISGLGGGHDAVTLDANADTVLSLSTQELGLDTQTANTVFAGPTSGGAAVPTLRSLVDDDIPNTITVDNATLAATATALAANGSNCAAGSYPLGVDASGAAESCTDATTEINSAISTHAGISTAHHTPPTSATFAENGSDELLGENLGTACAENEILKTNASGGLDCAADSTGGSPTFDSIATGTNTTATMTIGTGASMLTSGSGTIAATTAAALAANGANCNAGEYPAGVDAAGAVESCTDATTEINSAISTHNTATTSVHGIADTSALLTAETNALESDGASGIADTEIFIGTGAGAGNYAAMSGDATMTNAGVVTVANDSHTHTRTDTKCIYIENPTDADDLTTIWVTNVAATIVGISCETDQTVNMDLQIDDGSPAAVNGSSIGCSSTWAEDTSLAGDTSMAANDRLDLDIASTSGTPTWVSICWEYTTIQ